MSGIHARQDITSAIGNTPIIELSSWPLPGEGRLLTKLESLNPGGSLKDRPATQIINNAEETGELQPGGTIIESSSGNFGLALAMIAAARGYKMIAIVDPKLTPANAALFAAYGAEVIVVEQQDDSGSYHKTRIAYANRLHRQIRNSYRPDQCFNLQNSEAHYVTTAPELLAQCGPELHTIVCTASTGGQLGGISRYVKNHGISVDVIGVDVEGSAIFGGCSHAYLTPGVGLSWTPDNLTDLSQVSAAYKLSDADAFLACRTLCNSEGLLVGVSSGAAALVALKVARSLSRDRSVVFLSCDRGERYLDTAFSAEWLRSKGLDASRGVEQVRARADLLNPLPGSPQDHSNYQEWLVKELDSPTPAAHRRTPTSGASTSVLSGVEK